MNELFNQGLKVALSYLERGERFENELFLKLKKRGFDEDNIHQILLFLKEKKFLNDEKVLNNVIEYRLKVKREGKFKIIQNLLKRGVDRENIDIALGDISSDDIISSAVLCLKKKFKKDFDRNKGYRFLANRGYENTIIAKALVEFEENYEEL